MPGSKGLRMFANVRRGSTRDLLCSIVFACFEIASLDGRCNSLGGSRSFDGLAISFESLIEFSQISNPRKLGMF